jgi:lipopolysaccharide/colanic/teichoic acid biosynthesis glycosyltransferase
MSQHLMPDSVADYEETQLDNGVPAVDTLNTDVEWTAAVEAPVRVWTAPPHPLPLSAAVPSLPSRHAASRDPHFGPAAIAPAGNRHPFYLALKRGLDIFGALAILIAVSPIMLVTWAVLMITTRGQPIFRQTRVGHCGRTFTMFKFRTMVLNAPGLQHLVPNEHGSGPIFKNRRDPRITRIGRRLRALSIDELPQLFNVLRGEMSLVGPRPPVPAEVATYGTRERRRLAVQPGLTCLWQVSGRSEIGFDEWVRLDLWYLEHQSLWTDLWLLIRTPVSVLSRRGAY